ncbi:MAG: hypothetical protein ACRDRM_07270 [Pseudonocardiaceae bacterium]
MHDLEPATTMLADLVAGAPVPVPDDAPLLDRLLGVTGRDPAWRAGGSHA